MTKYTLTDFQKLWCGVTLRRIRAVRDIPAHGVAAGEVGGWIASGHNLAQDGDAWVAGEAIVAGDARVEGNATVSDRATVFGHATVTGAAVIGGRAHVYGHATIYDNSHVGGDAHVWGDAYVGGGSTVTGTAMVSSGSMHGAAYLDAGGLVTVIRSDRRQFSCMPQRCGSPIIVTWEGYVWTLAEAMAHALASPPGSPLARESRSIMRYFLDVAAIHGWLPARGGKSC